MNPKLYDWVKLYRVWVTLGAVVILLTISASVVAGVTINNRKKADRIAEQQRIEQEAQRQQIEEAARLAEQKLKEASPSPVPSPSTTTKSSPIAKTSPKTAAKAVPAASPTSSSPTTITWSYNGSTWQPSSAAPNCPDPMTLRTPVDLSTVTSILYPGQTRGGDYKPHGGFRFDNSADNTAAIRAPYDAVIVSGSSYTQGGETQYLFDFQTSCGIAYRFDHLKTLSSTLQAIADKLSKNGENDSRTTQITPVSITAGETLATQVGTSGNTFVDWGVYDLRNKNSVSSSNPLAQHGVCWFDWLSAGDESTVRNIGATAGNSSSDYCK